MNDFSKRHQVSPEIQIYIKANMYSLSEGALTRYGQAERWKMVKKLYGTTKTTRSGNPNNTKRKKNDGRPPDTAKELLILKSNKKQLNLKEAIRKKTPTPSLTAKEQKKLLSLPTPPPATISFPLDAPGYPWHQNSCWLDVSLQLLYIALRGAVDEFNKIQKGLPEHSGIHVVLSSLFQRYELDNGSKATSAVLRSQRDYLRKFLKRKKAIQSVMDFESLFVSVSNRVGLKLLNILIRYRPGFGI
jgi:hypothetical protein